MSEKTCPIKRAIIEHLQKRGELTPEDLVNRLKTYSGIVIEKKEIIKNLKALGRMGITQVCGDNRNKPGIWSIATKEAS